MSLLLTINCSTLSNALDELLRYYPNYYKSELILLAEDIIRWAEGELNEGNSILAYLTDVFPSPEKAMEYVSKRLLSLSRPFRDLN